MTYATAAAFRHALEDRLRSIAAGSNQQSMRLRKNVVFQRFLARLLLVAPDSWILKGGLALDFRLADHKGARPRATKDMDLASTAALADAESAVRRAVEVPLDDFFEFEIRRVGTAGEDPLAGGAALRYMARANLAGRVFEQVVIDIGFAPPALDPDTVEAQDLLGFAGIPPVRVPTLPTVTHVAEKVHAYTRTYGANASPSSRPKDLVDLVLLAQHEQFEAGELRRALEQTFDSRGTHPLPTALPSPPSDWVGPYRSLAEQVGIAPTLREGYAAARSFLDPLLSSALDASALWHPDEYAWHNA